MNTRVGKITNAQTDIMKAHAVHTLAYLRTLLKQNGWCCLLVCPGSLETKVETVFVRDIVSDMPDNEGLQKFAERSQNLSGCRMRISAKFVGRKSRS